MEKKPRRYNEEERKQLLERYQTLLAEGKNVVEAAKDLGVSYVTIRAWQKKDDKLVGGKTRARPVKAKARQAKKVSARSRKKSGVAKKAFQKTARPARAAGKDLVVVMPNGYRIEGFTVDGLIRLLKAVK